MSKQIEFDDIRKGDRIKTVRVFKEAFGRTRSTFWEGVAIHKDDDGDWRTSEGVKLTFLGTGATQTFHLIDRPKPPLPTEPGTVFRATEIRGVKCDVKVMVSSTRTGEDKIYFSSRLVDGADLHIGKHITAWEPIEGNKNNG